MRERPGRLEWIEARRRELRAVMVSAFEALEEEVLL